jgi:site-specific recombinase XerD
MGDKGAGRLEKVICDYLEWMESQGYQESTRQDHRRMLAHFVRFVRSSSYGWDEIFTAETLRCFLEARDLTYAHAVKGLARYLFWQGEISQPIANRNAQLTLAEIYEHYLAYHQRSSQAPLSKIRLIRRVLAAFEAYLQRHSIELAQLKIEHIDAFLAEFFSEFSHNTRRTYRSCLRGFLRYLYHERRIIKRDLALLVAGRRLYAQAKPPKFLRPHEMQKLFASLPFSSASDLRTYAMVHLAYFVGLRPVEISRISLDDISFRKAKLTLRDRKSANPVILPLPEPTLKAIVAYLIGGRAESPSRRLFLILCAPYGPVSSGSVGYAIRTCMKRAGISASPYWLRHTYAQNLLESEVSVFEIKEMLGHDKIESTRSYLHVHVKLMRKVLFDEEL